MQAVTITKTQGAKMHWHGRVETYLLCYQVDGTSLE